MQMLLAMLVFVHVLQLDLNRMESGCSLAFRETSFGIRLKNESFLKSFLLPCLSTAQKCGLMLPDTC